MEQPLLNKTYNFKAPTLVRCTLGPLKDALKVEGRIIYHLDLDVRRLVVLAICKTLLVHRTVTTEVRTSNLLVNATHTGIHSWRRRKGEGYKRR